MKKCQLKKIMVYVIVFICVSILVIIGNADKSVSIPNNIKVLLDSIGVENAQINNLCAYSNYKMEKEISEVTNEEINEYIDMQLESMAKIMPISSRDTVLEGDVVYVSYIVTYEDTVVKQVESDNLIVGVGEYNKEFEEILLGKNVGEPFSVELYFEDENGDKKRYAYNIIVESINYFEKPKITDEFVQKEFDVQSAEEYYGKCKEELSLEKEHEAQIAAEKDLFHSVIKECDFTIDKTEVASYSKYIVNEYEKMAYIYNMDIDTYVKEILLQDMDEFYQRCYDSGEYEIKKYLVIGAIFEDLRMEVTYQDYKRECENVGVNFEEAKKDVNVDALIQFNIMEDKVIKYFQNR